MKPILLLTVLALSGCSVSNSVFPNLSGPATGPGANASASANVTRPPTRPGDAPAAGDTATAEADATITPAAAAPATGVLGKTIVSLDASEPGVWLKTPLVKTRAKGNVSYKGKTVGADLIPIPGPATAGSRASLNLMQALGAPLTELPEVTVSR
ncbi:hypothetical protein [Pseudooceanicola sp.]|uniref:hypothetical protein n=1 Tax=Pseudooceanicola sp. TaxID=1914328 RepID=UPI004057D470|tara:strand:- start:170 stop:634 length:465 start_codon:yes stop_codon:yes gene_type:complete